MKTGFTVFEYLYRDASNYKARGELRLIGTVAADDEAALRACLESDELFIAEQVGVPVLYKQLWSLSNGPTIDDHAYHEFVELRPSTREDVASLPLWGKLSDLLDAFQKAQHRWNCFLSQNGNLT